MGSPKSSSGCQYLTGSSLTALSLLLLLHPARAASGASASAAWLLFSALKAMSCGRCIAGETDPGPGHKCLNTVGGCQDLDLCLLYTARGVMGQTDALWSWCKASCRIRQPGLEAPGRSLWWGPKAPCCCSVVGPPAAGYGDAARPRLAEYAICQLNVESDEPHCALQLGVSSCCRSGEASWSAGSLNAKHISDYVAGLVAGLQSLRQAVGAYRHSFASRATPVT